MIMFKPRMGKLPIRRPQVLSIALLGLALAGCLGAKEGTAPVPRGAAAIPRSQDERTVLDNYVAAPDTNYSYHLVNTVRGQDQTTYILEMTSQAWLTTNEVDRPLWKHWMIIVRPHAGAASKALLLIGGGINDGRLPNSADGNLVRIALDTKSVVAELKMVPNQPLVFAGEKRTL